MVILSKVSKDTLCLKPATNKWSVNEILTHLLTSEQLTLAYLRKKSLGVSGLKNSGLSERVRWIILKVSQRVPLRYTAPKHVVANTPKALPLEDLNARWTETRRELGEFLNTVADENIKKLIYKHPVAGRFDVVQCLMFMREHCNHHLPQIKRLL